MSGVPHSATRELAVRSLHTIRDEHVIHGGHAATARASPSKLGEHDQHAIHGAVLVAPAR